MSLHFYLCLAAKKNAVDMQVPDNGSDNVPLGSEARLSVQSRCVMIYSAVGLKEQSVADNLTLPGVQHRPGLCVTVTAFNFSHNVHQ